MDQDGWKNSLTERSITSRSTSTGLEKEVDSEVRVQYKQYE